MILLFQFMIGESVKIEPAELVEIEVEEYDAALLGKQIGQFENVILKFLDDNGVVCDYEVKGISDENYESYKGDETIYSGIKKEITLFYQDKGEYYNLLPIKKEAQNRGYLVRESSDLDEKAEIGIYCQHFGKPQNSKFSLVLLHDMAQGHNRWPNLWELERWNVYDIGILPGNVWAKRWEKCAFNYYANPRCGTYALGYPKSDFINKPEIEQKADELKVAFKLKYDTTVLYAPSWENDEKEDDFVRALATLNVNLLIKQAHWPLEYKRVRDDIEKMRKMHEGKYENVHYIEPDENIMVAYEMCDILVSEESSVMTELLMYKKPSISVTDWMIPDTTPSRPASVPFEYVCKCKKVELREKIERFIKNRNDIDIKESGDEFFNNIGNVNKNIVDAIDYYIGNGKDTTFKKWKLKNRYMPITLWS